MNRPSGLGEEEHAEQEDETRLKRLEEQAVDGARRLQTGVEQRVEGANPEGAETDKYSPRTTEFDSVTPQVRLGKRQQEKERRPIM